MSWPRTEATSAGRMLPIAKSTAVSQRNSLFDRRLSVMACRPSAGFLGAGTSMRDTSAYLPSTHAPCVSSNRTSRELRVHTPLSANTFEGTSAPFAICSRAYSYLSLRATSACRAPSAPNSCSTLATARGPEPNPVSASRQPERATSNDRVRAVRRAFPARRQVLGGDSGCFVGISGVEAASYHGYFTLVPRVVSQ